jgi:SAM-dependent methyltransferase
MITAFDQIADKYDADFTSTLIGTAQRNIVHKYLEKILSSNGIPIEPGQVPQILELNCGTGEDAVFFAKKGCNVLATDISEKMLDITKQKIEAEGLTDKICAEKLDIYELDKIMFDNKFDLIFSNFGGINCIRKDRLNRLPAAFRKNLNHSGRLIMVVMPQLCLWEIFYFLMKTESGKAFRRRNDSGLNVKLEEAFVLTSYYSPKYISELFSDTFKIVSLNPVGFFIPPTYLENFFAKRERIFQLIEHLENYVKNWSLLSSFSDHYIIDLQAK